MMEGMAIGAVLLATVLCTQHALAAEPAAVALPATAEGMGPGTVEAVDEIVLAKIPGTGYRAVQAGEKASACEPPACANAARGIGEALGAAKVVAIHVVKQGDVVVVTITVHDVATSAVQDGSATTTVPALLAQVAKLLKKVLTPPVVEKAPPPAEPEPVVEPPRYSKMTPRDAYAAAMEACLSDASPYHCLWADSYRSARILIVTGTAASAAGLGLIIATAVLWKEFDDWKDRVAHDCTSCLSKAVKKVKVNSVITGLAIAGTILGAVALASGLTKRKRLLDLRPGLDAAVPEVALGDGLVLTWRF